MASLTRTRIVSAMAFVAGAGLVAWAVAGADPRALVRLLGDAGPAAALVPVPFLVMMLLEAEAWRHPLAAIGRRVSLGGLLRVRLASEAVLMTTPGGAVVAEGVKLHLARRRLAIPGAEAIASLAVQKCLVFAGQAVFVAVATALGLAALEAISPRLPLVAAVGSGLALVAAAGAWLLVTRAAPARRLFALLRRLPGARLRAWLAAREDGFGHTDATMRRAASSGRSLVALGHATAAWFVEAVESALILWVLGAELPFTAILAVEALVSVVRAAAFVMPRGLGASDVSYVGLLGALGAGASLGGAFVLLKRSKDLVWAGIGWWLLARSAADPRLAPVMVSERAEA